MFISGFAIKVGVGGDYVSGRVGVADVVVSGRVAVTAKFGATDVDGSG